MKRIFDSENPLMRALAVVADLLVLNLLTLLCCVPIFTIGAALTAMEDILIHMVRKEEGYIFKPFFRSFGGNLKKGSLLGVLFLVIAAVLYFDYLAAAAYIPVFRVGIVALGLIELAIVIYTFALLARYENTVWGTLKNAVTLAVGFFPRTLGMMAFSVVFWLLCVRFYQIGAPLLLLFGLSLPGYVTALLINGVFDKIDNN